MNDTLQKLNNMICMEEDHGCMLSYAYIDPEMAEELLALSKGNRPLSKRAVAKYRRHMENGTWDQETPTQFIMFDKEGVLINGHHTLTALKQSGKTIKLWFMFNVNRSPYIDGGRTRSEADRFCMAEGTSASYRRSVAMCNVLSQCTPMNLVTEDERYQFIQTHTDEFQWASHDLGLSKAHLSTAPIRTALLLARVAGAPSVKLEHFWEVLQSGFSEQADDRVIIRLRDWIREQGTDSRSLEYRRTVLCTTSFILEKWLNGEKVRSVTKQNELVVWRPAV